MLRFWLLILVLISSVLIQAPARADWVADVKAFANLKNSGSPKQIADAAETLLRYRATEFPLSKSEYNELLEQIANSLAADGRNERAITLYENIIANIIKRSGPKSFDLVAPLQRLAELNAKIKKLDAAAQLYDRVISLMQGETGQGNPILRHVMVALQKIDQLRLQKAKGKPQSVNEMRNRIAKRAIQLETIAAVQRARELQSKKGLFLGRRGDTKTKAPFRLMQIYYGTNRKPTGNSTPSKFYGDRRGPLKLGIATVSVPKIRRPGEIQLPSLWRAEFRPNAAKHFIFTRLQIRNSVGKFSAEAARQISASTRKEALVFIHGYNTDFQKGLFRAAQLATDLDVDGATFMYSWPSKGSIIGYVADGAQVVRPVARGLAHFLSLVAAKTGAESVHIVAHSMGNRYLLEALDLMSRKIPIDKRKAIFKELVFAAPDVDADDFADRVSDLRWIAKRMTLYASARDRALHLSSIINGGYRRAGDASAIVAIKGLDTVDTSLAGGTGLGHGDFANVALDDFRAVIWLSLKPRDRCKLIDRKLPKGAIYWMLANQDLDHCPQESFRTAITTFRRFGTIRSIKYIADKIKAARSRSDRAAVSKLRKTLSVMKKLR